MNEQHKKGVTAALLDMMDQDPAVKRHIPKQRARLLPEPFPDYSKSLVTQNKSSPTMAGVLQGLGYGGIGTLLGALSGKLTEQDTNRTALLALLGGMLGAGGGFYSGKRQQESDNSRLNFLRRLGIDNPGELEALSEYPGLARKLTEEGIKT